MISHRHRRTSRRVAALSLAVTLLATSCSFGDDKDESVRTRGLGDKPVESGMPDDPKPRRGGQLVYGIESDSDGWCLPEAQHAISGMQVSRALFDTLTVPNAEGGYAPYLAKTIAHSDDYKTWTITLRPGITFHDGSKLTATVVKNNLDAYRGKYRTRSPLLFSFVFSNIDTVETVNELAVRVTTKTPWVAFPASLYASGRMGIVAQAQLDANPEDCATKPIGTGPFSFVSWTPEVSLKVKRNPTYWQKAPDGKPYPYLNAIEFRPIANSDARLAALQQGDINMLHTGTASDMAGNLLRLRDEGAANVLISEERTEVAYLQLNNSKPPFNDRATRIAAAQAIDKAGLNERGNSGFATVASGPFAPGVPGYLEDSGFPKYDPDAAKKAVAKLKAEGKSTTITLLGTLDPSVVRTSSLTKEYLVKAGFTVTLEIASQTEVIERAISGDFQAMSFRNQPGEDPDMNYIWWYGEANPVNFARFDDKVINENLVIGRTTPDPAKRKAAYETINRQFGKEAYNLWSYFSPWAIVESPKVHGILGPDLPGDGGPPPGRIVTGHPLIGIWIDEA